MSPLREIRPATPAEVALLLRRRNRGHEGHQRPKNLELFQEVSSQLDEAGSVTLVFDINDFYEASRIGNLLRAAFLKKQINIETSILKEKDKETKLIIRVS